MSALDLSRTGYLMMKFGAAPHKWRGESSRRTCAHCDVARDAGERCRNCGSPHVKEDR